MYTLSLNPTSETYQLLVSEPIFQVNPSHPNPIRSLSYLVMYIVKKKKKKEEEERADIIGYDR
jgi:hypothetical protein